MKKVVFRGLELMTGEWVYGSHLKTGTGIEYIVPQNLIANLLPQYAVDKDTVGQYTGRKDDNDVDIYSNDVVRCNFMGYQIFNAVVRFGEYEQDGSGGEYAPNKCIGFYADAINKKQMDDFDNKLISEYVETTSLLAFERIEVIGNIHLHPELLEEHHES